MAEIGFYHLTRSSAEAALPALLGRTLAAARRAVVRVRDRARANELDAGLWQAPEPIWLPHGTEGAGETGEAALQPIWITPDTGAPNGASFLFLLDGVAAPDAERFERVFDLFDGNDPAAVAAARLRWAEHKAAGHGLAYWRQEPKGWVRAA